MQADEEDGHDHSLEAARTLRGRFSRPYLAHGMEICIEMAQQGGVGLVVYNRKEGRALGEVTKFLVYNARKRQPGGDSAAQYFNRTECVAGVQDMRFQELMPDVLNWLGIKRIHRLVSMSNLKYDAIVGSGIGGLETLLSNYEVLRTKGPDRVSPFFIPMLIVNMASGVISMRLGAKGPNSSVVTACATGNHAIGDATKIIERGDA